MSELLARLQYNFNCLVMKDDSWDMGAELTGSVWPWGGFWLNERGAFKTYAESQEHAGGRDAASEFGNTLAGKKL